MMRPVLREACLKPALPFDRFQEEPTAAGVMLASDALEPFELSPGRSADLTRRRGTQHHRAIGR